MVWPPCHIVGESRRVIKSAPATNCQNPLSRHDVWKIPAQRTGQQWVQTLPCAEQYRAMAFAQLTYRESLRDIEACLSAQPGKLYHMGFHGPVRRSTPAFAGAGYWRMPIKPAIGASTRNSPSG